MGNCFKENTVPEGHKWVSVKIKGSGGGYKKKYCKYCGCDKDSSGIKCVNWKKKLNPH